MQKNESKTTLQPDWNVVSGHLMDRVKAMLAKENDLAAHHSAFILASLAEAIQKGLIANV